MNLPSPLLKKINPSARGTYMLRKFVGVGFHSSPGEGARAVMRNYYEIKKPSAARGRFLLISCKNLQKKQVFEMKPLKNGIRLTVNGLGVPPP
jgi:hypothetical protein